MHTGASLAAALELFHTRVPINPGDVVHTDQLMLGLPTLISGARWSLPPLGGSPTTFADHLRSRGATHTYCVPTHLAEVLDASGDTLPAHLRHVILGSAPAPAPLLRRTIAAAPHADVTSVYAMTEILPVAIATAADKLAHTASGATGDLLGSPLPGVDVALTSDGELLLRGPNRCSGYLGDPPPEWLPTGDLARLDDAGRIVLIGRKKDMIIRDGFNLYPGLYEPAIRAEHGVADAAYVGVPHPDTGDEHVVLAVVPTTPDDHTLVQHLTRRLPHIVDHGAMPDRIVLTRELPRSGRSRKLDRAALLSLVQGKS